MIRDETIRELERHGAILSRPLEPIRYEWHELPFYKQWWFAAKVLLCEDAVELPIKKFAWPEGDMTVPASKEIPLSFSEDFILGLDPNDFVKTPYKLEDYLVPVRHYTKEKPKLTLIKGGKYDG